MWNKFPEIEKQLDQVEKTIRKNLHSRNKLLTQVVKDLMEAGGKRLRPAFTILASKYGSHPSDNIIKAAGAIEILHAATLVHDDVIDRSRLRRGRPTVAYAYGMDMAIYTGDYLYTRGLLMLSVDIPLPKIHMVAKAIKTICEGEVDQYQDKYNLHVSVYDYLKRIQRKTALLFSVACGMGAYLSDCSPKVVHGLSKFGTCYGTAFQIRDDINNYISNAETSGKPVGNDVSEGIVTLPLIYAISQSEGVKEKAAGVIQKGKAQEEEELSKLNQLVREAGGIGYAQKILQKYVHKGLKQLNALPDNPYKNVFYQLISELSL